MRVFLQIFLPFAAIVTVFLTPTYLKKIDHDDERDDSVLTTLPTTTPTPIITRTLKTTTSTIPATTAPFTTTSTQVTTTTTEQDEQDPCAFQCSSSHECTIIVGKEPIKPTEGNPKGSIVASKEFRLNIGIDFPSHAAVYETNIVHERSS